MELHANMRNFRVCCAIGSAMHFAEMEFFCKSIQNILVITRKNGRRLFIYVQNPLFIRPLHFSGLLSASLRSRMEMEILHF